MSFIRAKTIKNQVYYYLVKSQRIGNKVKQIHIKYLGKSAKRVSSSDGALSENKLDRKSLAHVPNDKPGIYRLYNRDGSLVYIGTADNLKDEISSHRIKDDTQPIWKKQLSAVAEYFTFTKCKDEDKTRLADSEINKYQPKYNENESMNIQEVKN